jgi:hypothetical protein
MAGASQMLHEDAVVMLWGRQAVMLYRPCAADSDDMIAWQCNGCWRTEDVHAFKNVQNEFS